MSLFSPFQARLYEKLDFSQIYIYILPSEVGIKPHALWHYPHSMLRSLQEITPSRPPPPPLEWFPPAEWIPVVHSPLSLWWKETRAAVPRTHIHTLTQIWDRCSCINTHSEVQHSSESSKRPHTANISIISPTERDFPALRILSIRRDPLFCTDQQQAWY